MFYNPDIILDSSLSKPPKVFKDYVVFYYKAQFVNGNVYGHDMNFDAEPMTDYN